MANLSPSGNGGVSFVIVMNATYACTWAFWRIFSRLPCSRIGASIMEIWFQRQPRCMAARDHAFAPHLQLFRTEVLRGLDCVGLILTQQDALSASFWPWAPVSANWLLHPVRETRNTCKTGSFFPIFFNPHDGPDMCPFLSIWSSKKLESTWHIQWHLCCHWPKRLLTDTATEMNKDVAAQCSRKKPLQTTWKRNHFRFNEFNSFNRFNSHHENFKALDPGSKLGKTWQNGKTTFCFALARSPAWFVHGASISGHLLSCVWCTHHLPEPGVHWNLGCQWHLS